MISRSLTFLEDLATDTKVTEKNLSKSDKFSNNNGN